MNGKNIYIYEKDERKTLSDVWRIKVKDQKGGMINLVPADSLNLVDVTITAAGTYNPNNEGYYGYNTVTVNLPQRADVEVNTLTGTDAVTGITYRITLDANGNIVRTPVT